MSIKSKIIEESIAVQVDGDKKTISILEAYNMHHSHGYLEIAKAITEKIGSKILDYKVIFKDNKTFKNVLELGSKLLEDHTEEVKKRTNPKPDTTHYKDLGIKNIDYDKQIIFFDTDNEVDVINFVRMIVPIAHFQIIMKDKVFDNLSALIKKHFSDKKEYPDNCVLEVTNELINHFYQEMFAEDELEEDEDEE